MKKLQKNAAPFAKKSGKKPADPSPVVEKTQDDELYVISNYLKTLRFAPALMGVDEVDVWKKIEKLCELYADALTAERGRCEKLQRQLDALTAKGPGDSTVAAGAPVAEREEQPHGQ